MPSCAESTRLMSEAQERALSGGERVALRWHLLLCGACRSFERQLGWLRRASDHYPPPEYAPPEPPPADGADGADGEPAAGA